LKGGLTALIVCWKRTDFGGSTGMDACRAALSRVSGEIGATNACTRMYRLGFLWSMECVIKKRMAACPPKSVHFQVAEGHTMGLPFSWLLLLGKQKK